MRKLVVACVVVVALAGCSGNDEAELVVEDVSSPEEAGASELPVCVPQCEGKECGSDGCAGQCGECAPLLEECSENFQCVPFSCKSSLDCPGSLVCLESEGICVVCGGDEDCEEGLFCGTDHTCHEPKACTSDKDCKEYGLVCDKEAGQCVECVHDNHCPDDHICAGGFCLELVCEPGETLCDDDKVKLCNETGTGSDVVEDCTKTGGTCLAGECVYCIPDCEGKECGDDGCGGSCGDCAGDNCVDGVCVCQPACDGKECGDNGCGGSCGTCPGPQEVCIDGDCVCQPTCDGKECGGDGCGGTCGECAGEQESCIDGACVCQPACDGKECGPDGCGGNCGLCTGPQDSCVAGTCICQPACGGKECGTDGCGGSCGSCPDGQYCTAGICGDDPCQPSCLGKECGDDGCGGSCGACPVGWQCQAGLCVPSATCPTAVIQCAEGDEVIPQTTLHLYGDQSYASNGLIQKWEWTVEQPGGSQSVFIPSFSFPNPTFETNVAGVYTFYLTVYDQTNTPSCFPDTFEVVVIPDEAIHIELTWHTPEDPDETDTGPEAGSDLDLHFLHPWAAGPDLDGDGSPDGWFDIPFDCFWFNAHPNWGSYDPAINDDPGLDRDDTDGAGPENINLDIPENVVYKVGVHYWNAHGYGTSYATVRVYIYAQLVFEMPDVMLVDSDMWEVCTVEWPSGKVNVVTNDAGQYKITPAYHNPYFFQ